MPENPETQPQQSTISPKTMHQYYTHRNIPWNIVEYHPKKQYLDPAMQFLKRKYAQQKKGSKDRRYFIKKGYYMDYHNKIAKSIPGSPKYQKNQPWNFDKEKRLAARIVINKKLKKYTYLDQIQIEQKIRKSPGVCTYSLEKSLKKKQEQAKRASSINRFVGQKHFYHHDQTFLADKSPGAGNYNPHYLQQKIRKNQTGREFWIEKHAQIDEKLTKRLQKEPNAVTYSPMHQSFTTFDSVQLAKKKENSKKNCFGKDSRFEYTRPVKKIIIEKRPGPSSYRTSLQWRSKTESPKKNLWQNSVWKGFNPTVYY